MLSMGVTMAFCTASLTVSRMTILVLELITAMKAVLVSAVTAVKSWK